MPIRLKPDKTANRGDESDEGDQSGDRKTLIEDEQRYEDEADLKPCHEMLR